MKRTVFGDLRFHRKVQRVDLHHTLHLLAVVLLVLFPDLLRWLHVDRVVLVVERVADHDHVRGLLPLAFLEPASDVVLRCPHGE